MPFDDILRTLLGQGQQPQQNGSQLPGQPQQQQQQQQWRPQQGFQTPPEWLALTMHNSGQSWSDTLTKAAAITQNQQKVDNENYEMQLKQQQMLAEQQRKEGLRKLFSGDKAPTLDQIIEYTKNGSEAAALHTAQQNQYTTDMLGRPVILPKVGGRHSQQGSAMPGQMPQQGGMGMGQGQMPPLNQQQPYGSPLEEKLDVENRVKEKERVKLLASETEASDKLIDESLMTLETGLENLNKIHTNAFSYPKYLKDKAFGALGDKGNANQAKAYELFNNSKAKILAELAQLRKGEGGISNYERSQIAETTIGGQLEEGANKHILTVSKAIAKKQLERNKAFRLWIRDKGTDEGFADFWKDYKEKYEVVEKDKQGNPRINMDNLKKWENLYKAERKTWGKSARIPNITENNSNEIGDNEPVNREELLKMIRAGNPNFKE